MGPEACGEKNPNECPIPESIAAVAATLILQDPSAWTFERDLRPNVEPW